jgi:hypothetical protein
MLSGATGPAGCLDVDRAEGGDPARSERDAPSPAAGSQPTALLAPLVWDTGLFVWDTGLFVRDTGLFVRDTGLFFRDTGLFVRDTGLFVWDTLRNATCRNEWGLTTGTASI